MSTNLSLPYSIEAMNPFLIDSRSGPWNTIEDANANIPMEVRVRGLIAIVKDGIGAYFYRDGIEDEDLVPVGKDVPAVWGNIEGILAEQADLQAVLNDLYKRDNYTHTQDVSTTVWNVEHNMGKNPSVECIDTAGSEMIGDVRYITINTLTITFSHPVSGKAYLN